MDNDRIGNGSVLVGFFVSLDLVYDFRCQGNANRLCRLYFISFCVAEGDVDGLEAIGFGILVFCTAGRRGIGIACSCSIVVIDLAVRGKRGLIVPVFHRLLHGLGDGVEVFDGGEDHGRADREGTFVGFNADGDFCLFRESFGGAGRGGAGRAVLHACGLAGTDADGVLETHDRHDGGLCVSVLIVFVSVRGILLLLRLLTGQVFLIAFRTVLRLFFTVFLTVFCVLYILRIIRIRFDSFIVFRRDDLDRCADLIEISSVIFFYKYDVRGPEFAADEHFRCSVFCGAGILVSVLVFVVTFTFSFISFNILNVFDIGLIQVHLAQVEIDGKPAADLLAGPGGLAGGVVGVLVLFDGVGGEGEDEILAQVGALLTVEALVVIDVLYTDSCADEFLAGSISISGATGVVPARSAGVLCEVIRKDLIRGAGALDSFGAEVPVVVVRVGDGQGVVIDIGRGNAVLNGIDAVDLVISQMKVGGQAVGGRRIGLVEAACGNSV